MTELEQKLRDIADEKDAKVLPENIKKDLIMFGVTGTLEPGPLTQPEYDSCENYTNLILYGGEPPLPYVELEYIQSTGTQYIDTIIQANSTLKIIIDFQFNTLAHDNILFGAISSHQQGNFCRYSWALNDNRFWGMNDTDYNSSHYTYITPWDTNRHTLVFNKDDTHKNIFDSVEYGGGINSAWQSNTYLPLFCDIDYGQYKRNASAKLYSCKIYNQYTILVRDFIPVKRKSDNVICLYDKVSDTFFENAGTGVFIAGPEKEVDE